MQLACHGKVASTPPLNFANDAPSPAAFPTDVT
jgi:hypothetical protein